MFKMLCSYVTRHSYQKLEEEQDPSKFKSEVGGEDVGGWGMIIEEDDVRGGELDWRKRLEVAIANQRTYLPL
ncbi:hypothetical protein KSS87_000719 [Heliosperma pusillum]|nr:hypothetical protein KSS87_000719 [Heliosperma pusillum]